MLVYLWFTFLWGLLLYDGFGFLYWPQYFHRSVFRKINRICSQYKCWMGGPLREAKLRGDVLLSQLGHASRKLLDTRLKIHEDCEVHLGFQARR